MVNALRVRGSAIMPPRPKTGRHYAPRPGRPSGARDNPRVPSRHLDAACPRAGTSSARSSTTSVTRACAGGSHDCWRRSTALAVTLWIDEPAALARIVPGGSRRRVRSSRWTASGPAPLDDRLSAPAPPAKCRTSSSRRFGCGLPEAYVAALAAPADAARLVHPRIPVRRALDRRGTRAPVAASGAAAAAPLLVPGVHAGLRRPAARSRTSSIGAATLCRRPRGAAPRCGRRCACRRRDADEIRVSMFRYPTRRSPRSRTRGPASRPSGSCGVLPWTNGTAAHARRSSAAP